MASSSSQGLTVITVPLKMKTQIERAKKMKNVFERKNILKQSRKGNASVPVISCKNEKLNFYKGQSYAKFQNIPLVSTGWKGRKSKGDYFVINRYSENPAFMNVGDEPETFEDLSLDSRIIEQLRKVGYTTPTNIQKLAIPTVLKGFNSIISAETGNGKTLAYLAPIIQQVLKIKENLDIEGEAIYAPKALIIVPGRELVSQTTEMARSICNDLGIKVNMFYGGRTKRLMTHPRTIRPDILVGSFGALSKLMTSRIVKRNYVGHVVLDEADTLLDDSFNKNVSYFLSKFPRKIQEVGANEDFSGIQLTLAAATFPRNKQSILRDVIDVNSLVEIKTPYLHRISPHISHHFLKMNRDSREEKLMRIVKKNKRENIPTIIFSNTAVCSDFVSLFLNSNEIDCININSNMTAMQRRGRFDAFQNGSYNFISCTDLVSRGLNTVRAKHIINYEFPKFVSDYIHRCGRTGRVGNDDHCHVTNFISSKADVDLVQKIEFTVRKTEVLPEVNANIKRLINSRKKRQELHELRLQEKEEIKEEIKSVDQELGNYHRMM